MKKYKCVKPFYIPEVDVYGNETENDIEIKTGKIYELDESGSTYLSTEVHLDSLDGCSWIEIGNKTFRECFEEVKGGAE